jgi:hypothetical protein
VVVRDKSVVEKRRLFSPVRFVKEYRGSGGIALLILNPGTWWRRVIMLRPLSHDKEILVYCEYETQNRSVRFPDCKHCEIFCSTFVDRKIVMQEVYLEAKFVFRNFGF